MRLLPFFAAILAVTVADNSYVIVAPSKIRPNMDLSISVNILQAASDVTVTARVTRGKTDVASGSGVFAQGKPGTLHIKLPADLASASYTLNVEGSGGLKFKNFTTLSFSSKAMSVFIQTDKAMYKPGAKVNFRTFAIQPDLKTYTGLMDISIADSAGNKIKQWLDVPATEGVITKSFTLSTQPVQGDWTITAKTDRATERKVFTVAEYVLPKFKVDVIVPSYALQTDKEVVFTVRSTYTYGKPVKGVLDASVKLLYASQTYGNSRDVPIFKINMPIDGDTKVSFPMSKALEVTSYLANRMLTVVVNVTESLTGNTLSGTGSVKIYQKGVKMEYPDTNPNTFKPGLQYTAYLKVSQPDDLPLVGATGTVSITTRVTAPLKVNATAPPDPYFWQPTTYSYNLPAVQVSVPTNGLVVFAVDVPKNATSIYLTAKHTSGISASKSISKSYSPSDSYIQLALRSTSAIQAGDSINFEVVATQTVSDLTYQVLSRGGIVDAGSIQGNNLKKLAFSVAATSAMAPDARIVVYFVRKDGEIVTDSISFNVGGAFKNRVSISMNETNAEPGEPVKVTVKADANSKAYILAVDQSVLLLKSGNDVTADDVYTELKTYDTISKSSNDDFLFGRGGPIAFRRRKRMVFWPYPVFYGGSDATQIFKNAGVVVLTDALVFRHIEPIRGCGRWRCPIMFRQMAAVDDRMPMAMAMPSRKSAMPNGPVFGGVKSKEPLEVDRIRTHFPETWLWTDVDTGANGMATVETTVPDTITSWVASAFAVNQQSGLGIAPSSAMLKVFRPFFVSLNLPYSVTRGEQVSLQAIVFNYMTIDQQVQVTLARSDEFFNILINRNGNEVLNQDTAQQTITVNAGQARSVYFPIVPSELGKINIEVKAQSYRAADAVRRQLLVEAEGVPKEYNVPVLVDMTNSSNAFSKTVNLTLPPNVVAGSELTKVSAIGDIMGPSINGLDQLLKMPTGCGEQTMLGLAPDVYITNYLESTKQLTGSIKDKALKFMESGYQRELTYKHTDGSFSAFGNSDDSGSMWLTAFVSRVFHQAKSHIFVDDKVLLNAINWMIQKQKSDGSFPEPGRVIHKNMQGQAGSGTKLSIFVLISLLENQDLYKNSPSSRFVAAKDLALKYVESEVAISDDLYLLTMASYALQLANSPMTQTVLDKLEKKALVVGGHKYWHQPQTKKATKGVWHSPNPTIAIDTEMTSYVLMTYALRKDLATGKSILQWVTQQRNANGGFSSTQDTVVALNALSLFSELVYSNNFDMQVGVQLDNATPYTFTINAINAIITQRREAKTVPAKATITGTGNGLALVDISVFFNVEAEVEDTTFSLKVNLLKETMNLLRVQICTSWLGDGPASGMAVQEIGIPSGFDADLESFPSLKTLKRIETQDKKVILYFDEIGTADMCIEFDAVRTGLVAKSQPAAVRIYDYYEPTNQVTGFYQSQILKDSTVCDVCKECENCI